MSTQQVFGRARAKTLCSFPIGLTIGRADASGHAPFPPADSPHLKAPRRFEKVATGLLALAASDSIFAQAFVPVGAMLNPPVRLRGTIEKVEADSPTAKERSGEVIMLARRPTWT